jgi:hypothetical protein
MTCKWDHEYIWQCLVIAFTTLRQSIGDDGIIIVILATSSIILLLGFYWTQRLVVPRVVRFIVEDLIRKAREMFNRSWLFKEGIRFNTCVVSVILASMLYPMLKMTVRFPAIWRWSLVSIAIALVCVSIVGRLFSPYFYIPALTALGLFVVNFILDFTFHLIEAGIGLSGKVSILSSL